MPLFEKVRIEVYIPDLPQSVYRELLDTLEMEFTYTFGGCTIVEGLHGSYQSQAGFRMQDRVNLIYTDAPFTLDSRTSTLSLYTDMLYSAAFEALNEEAILVAAYRVHHARVKAGV